MKSEHA